DDRCDLPIAVVLAQQVVGGSVSRGGAPKSEIASRVPILKIVLPVPVYFAAELDAVIATNYGGRIDQVRRRHDQSSRISVVLSEIPVDADPRSGRQTILEDGVGFINVQAERFG